MITDVVEISSESFKRTRRLFNVWLCEKIADIKPGTTVEIRPVDGALQFIFRDGALKVTYAWIESSGHLAERSETIATYSEALNAARWFLANNAHNEGRAFINGQEVKNAR